MDHNVIEQPIGRTRIQKGGYGDNAVLGMYDKSGYDSENCRKDGAESERYIEDVRCFRGDTDRERAERTGRNPQTGEEITIPASKQVAFKVSKTLKDAINS